MQPKKQLKVQYIGIFEEIKSYVQFVFLFSLEILMSVKLIIPMRICFLSFFLDSMFPKYVISTDSAYTERYMGLPVPEGNWKGFTESSLIGKAEYIQDNRWGSRFRLFLVLFGCLSFDENIYKIYT